MKRLSFLLLDANVIIHLFEIGLWDRIVDACDLYVCETVVGEAHYFEDARGTRHDFDVQAYVDAGKIKSFSVPVFDVKRFIDAFDPSYMEKLDDGEAESLTYLVKFAPAESLICSADAIVFRVLGTLDRSHQGISMEEMLAKLGLARKCEWQWTKGFREKWSQDGVTAALQGRGKK